MNISLRPLTVAGIDDDFVSWHQNDDGHLDYYTGSRRSFSKQDLIDWVSSGPENNTHFYLIMLDENLPIGTVKIGPIDTRNKTSDLACLIGSREHVGKGIGARAIALASTLAFKTHGVRRLHSGMFESNTASIKAYCRAGWQIEGRMKGFYLVDGKPMDRICVACFNPDFSQWGAAK